MSKTLGRGLNSLIPSKKVKEDLSIDIVGSQGPGSEIEISKIQANPQQPRQDFEKDSIQELANSIKEHGIIQPLVVQSVENGYQLIAGERRLLAAKIVGLKKIPVVIRSVNEQGKLELALVENIQRQNLNPIERAYGYQRLIDEFSLTQDEVGKKVSQSRATVANSIRLLSLPAEMQKTLQAGKITEGHAKVLLGIKSEEERQRIFKEIIRGTLSVRKTEHQAQKVIVKKHSRRKGQDPNLLEKEDLMQQALGTRVEIKKKGGQGTVQIHFYSTEELQAIINKITK